MSASETHPLPIRENRSAHQLAALLDIARRALDADTAAQQRKAHEAELKSAYAFHKFKHGLAHIEQGSFEWDMMMLDTQAEYQDAEKAKRAEYNARRRLQTAIRSYRSA